MTAATEPLIGVINAGSSSLKFSFYEGVKRLLTGQVEGLGGHPAATATGPDGEAIAPPELGSAPPTTPVQPPAARAAMPMRATVRSRTLIAASFRARIASSTS